MNTRTEWGIRYEDTQTPSMTGPVFVTMPVASEHVARTATTWTHGSWRNRDVVVVSREVTEWEER